MEATLAIARARRRAEPSWWDWDDEHRQPRGGWMERVIRWSFWLALALSLFGRWAGGCDSSGGEPRVPSAEHTRILEQKAGAAYAAVMNKPAGTWTAGEVAEARNTLVLIRNRFPKDHPNYARLREHVDRVVHTAFQHSINRMQTAATTAERWRTNNDDAELRNALNMSHPHERIVSARGEVEDGFGAAFKMLAVKPVVFFGSIYLLFIPFAFLVFLARMQQHGFSFFEEVVYGWRNLVTSTLFWPVGIESYPRSTARVLRHERLKAEFRARKPWGYQLTSRDEAEINRLVGAPLAELRARLEAIREVPQTAVFQARMAFYAAMFVGMLLAPLRAARAQSSGGSAGPGNQAAATETFKPSGEAHGFIHMAAGSEQPFGIPLAWARGIAHAANGLDFQLLFNPASGTVPEMFAIVRPDGLPCGLRIGQFGTRITFMTLPPHREKLIGGPGVGAHILFRDVGVEAFDDTGAFQWSLAGFSGSGINKPDENDAKDAVTHVGLKPWGPLLFELGLRAGEQPDGFRTHAMAHVNVAMYGLDLDLLGSRIEANGVAGVIGSAAVAYRPEERWLRWLEWAAGFDEFRPDGALEERVVRGEVNVFAPNNHARFGLMYGRQLVAGTQSVTGRLQMEF